MHRFLPLVPALLAGCAMFAPDSPALDATFKTKTASGLGYTILTPGKGDVAQAGDTVTVHYTGWLTSGKQFDSSRKSGNPFSFKLGAGEVVQGWDEGVAGMKVGERRKLVVPAALGYGSQGSGPVPGNATMVFDVELLKVGH